MLVYCPKKETRSLISLRPVKHEVRYYLVIEASINSYLHRTICVRSPLQVWLDHLCYYTLAAHICVHRMLYSSSETKHRTRWVFITKKR